MAKEENSRPEKPKALNIIAIGASAGGLEALQDFLAHLPVLDNTAVIIAQHLSPKHKSLLVQLLSKQTQLAVAEAQDQAQLEAGTVYITPPDKEISLQGGRLCLAPPPSSIGPKPSVNVLYHSLAALQEQKLVAVILSGTGSDGAEGMAALKGDHIYKIVQDPRSAKYDGMPQSALNAGAVDAVLAPEKMGQAIEHFFRQEFRAPGKAEPSSPDAVLEQILFLLGERRGTDFSRYKKATLRRRLEKRMQMLEISEAAEYLQRVRSSPPELDELFNMMLIGVTQFFRDSEAYKALREPLNALVASKRKGESLRVWVPGCSSGEEAYSLAILLEQIAQEAQLSLNLQIFATDIDERAIAFARKGLYPASSLDNLAPEWREGNFVPRGKQYEVSKKLRGKVLFSTHDLSQNPPFLRLDLISCRNLLIYFGQQLQQQVLPLFHYALAPEGLLFLGLSETIGSFNDLFASLDSKHKIYQRKRGGSIHKLKFSSFKPRRETSPQAQPLKSAPGISLKERLKDTLFNSYEHPYVLVNSDYDIHEVYGDVRLFMSLTAGNIQVNLLKMVNPELQIELRGLLTKAFKENESQRSAIKRFLLFGQQHFVRLRVKPLLYQDQGEELFMVVFERLELEEFLEPGPALDSEEAQSSRVQELEMELATTKEHLQTYIEEIETSNEELQSLNEELQSTNEELQSSNEELETTNEELQSTNEEIQIAYAELKTAHAELTEKDQALRQAQAGSEALLNNRLQALLLIDSSYRIIVHNEKAELLFLDLSGKRIGKGLSLLDFLPPGHLETYLADFRGIFNGDISEKEGEHQAQNRATEERWLRFHLNAINHSSGRPQSLSLALLDITETKEAQEALKSNNRRLQTLLNSQTHYVLRTDLEGNHTYWNEVFERDYAWLYTKDGIAGQNGLLSICEHDHEIAREAAEACIAEPGRVIKVELDKPGENGVVRTTLWEFLCIADAEGHPHEIQCMGLEITNLKQLRENERLLNESQALARLGNWNFDMATGHLTWSPALYQIFGLKPEDFDQSHPSFLALIVEEDRPRALAASKLCQETGKAFNIQYRIQLADGEERQIEEHGYAEKDEKGRVVRLFGTAQDISERVRSEAKLRDSDRIFEYATDMLCIANTAGYFEVVNPAWTRCLGWTAEELCSRPFVEFIHPDDRSKTSAEAVRVNEGKGSLEFENRYRCKDGSYRWLAWSSQAFAEEGRIYASARDVTREKEMNLRLVESERRFRRIFESLPNISVQGYNEKREVIYWNQASETVYGYRKEEALGKPLEELIIPPASAAKVLADIEEWTQKGEPIRSEELLLQRKNGEAVAVYSNHLMMENPKGEKELYCVDIDLTELRAAEHQIKEQENQYRIVADNTYNWEFWEDADGHLLYLSPSVQRVTGYSAEELLEQPERIESMIVEEDRETYRKHRHHCLQRKKGESCIFRIRNRAGELRHIEHVCQAATDQEGHYCGIRGTNIDITARIAVEEQLLESEQYYRSLLKAQPDSLYVLDKDYRYLDYKSRRGEGDKKRFVGRYLKDCLPEETARQLEACVEACFAGQELVETEYRLEIEGQERIFNGRFVAIDQVKLVLVVREVTEAHQNLQRIKGLLAEQEAHTQRLTNFTHIVSHNLRSHTANMQGILSLLEIEEPEILSNAYVGMIQESAENLSETLGHLNQILDISRNLEEKFTPCSLQAAVKRNLRSIQQLADDAGVNIISKLPAKEVWIASIPAYLDSVILNLLTNAIKFREPARRPEVKIGLRRQKGGWELSVRDNGLGIDLERHGNQLFDMYRTFHRHPDSKGLGLFIVKNQVEAMGGSIAVSSAVGKGSRFQIFLPSKKLIKSKN